MLLEILSGIIHSVRSAFQRSPVSCQVCGVPCLYAGLDGPLAHTPQWKYTSLHADDGDSEPERHLRHEHSTALQTAQSRLPHKHTHNMNDHAAPPQFNFIPRDVVQKRMNRSLQISFTKLHIKAQMYSVYNVRLVKQ